ncbi:MAG: DUF1080 domain-containing protein [Pseudomonadota bacterium]
MMRIFGAALLATAMLGASPSVARDDPAAPFLGRWDVALQTPQRTWASWFDIERDGDGVKVRMVGRWGHARWLPGARIANGHIQFTSPKADENSSDDLLFDGARSGDALVGSTTGNGAETWTWRAVRAPSLARARAPHWGAPIQLFDGHDLEGWTLLDPAHPSWQVNDGVMVSAGSGSELRTDATFTDFKLHLEYKNGPGGNSGVYLRGRYEVQIENDNPPQPPSMRTAGVYGFLAPTPEPARTTDVWHTYDITLVGRRITVIYDGALVIDRQEIPGVTGGALDADEGSPGPLMLQGSENGHLEFRNIVLTPAQ